MLKEFFTREVLLKCLIFSMIVSLVLMWRFTHIRHLPFFSTEALQVYGIFVLIDFLILLFVFFLLFWLSKRKQEY